MTAAWQLWRFTLRLVVATVIVIAVALGTVALAAFLTFRKRVRR